MPAPTALRPPLAPGHRLRPGDPRAFPPLRQGVVSLHDLYSVTFTPVDALSTGAGEMAYQIRDAINGGGNMFASGTCTSGTPVTTVVFSDTGLVLGPNTRYVRTRDGAANWTDTPFTVIQQTSTNCQITAPLTTIPGLPFNVTWAAAGTQADYQVTIMSADLTQLLYDSGIVASAAMTAAVPVGTPLVNGVSYQVRVTMHTTDVPALVGISPYQPFSPSWTAPTTIAGLTLTKSGEQT